MPRCSHALPARYHREVRKLILASFLLAACHRPKPVVYQPLDTEGGSDDTVTEPDDTTATDDGTPPTTTNPPATTNPPTTTQPKPEPVAMYALDEAISDALAEPLTYIGTGGWFGQVKNKTCAYRNSRVIVVNVYCTPKEMTSFSVVVLSPKKGRAYFYAEAKAPVSTVQRDRYFTFKAETGPVVVDAKLPALKMDGSYADLRAWDEKRYQRYAPSCSGGVELGQPQTGCSKELDAQADAWTARNGKFFQAPPPEWYRIVKELRTRAATDGTK